MRRFGKIRVSYFDAQLSALRKRDLTPAPDRDIQRIPGNPMLRYEARTPEQLGLNIASSPQQPRSARSHGQEIRS
jgi:hypothetical protein